MIIHIFTHGIVKYRSISQILPNNIHKIINYYDESEKNCSHTICSSATIIRRITITIIRAILLPLPLLLLLLPLPQLLLLPLPLILLLLIIRANFRKRTNKHIRIWNKNSSVTLHKFYLYWNNKTSPHFIIIGAQHGFGPLWRRWNYTPWPHF